MDLWRSKGRKDQRSIPWITPAWTTELTTDVWEDVSTLSDTFVFIFFSFHKGCGLSTFEFIYQQIYLLLLPASVYIQRVSWVRVVYEAYGVWLMGVFVTHGFIGLTLTCLSPPPVFVFRNVSSLDVGFIFLFSDFCCLFRRCFYNCSLGKNSDY